MKIGLLAMQNGHAINMVPGIKLIILIISVLIIESVKSKVEEMNNFSVEWADIWSMANFDFFSK